MRKEHQLSLGSDHALRDEVVSGLVASMHDVIFPLLLVLFIEIYQELDDLVLLASIIPIVELLEVDVDHRDLADLIPNVLLDGRFCPLSLEHECKQIVIGPNFSFRNLIVDFLLKCSYSA